MRSFRFFGIPLQQINELGDGESGLADDAPESFTMNVAAVHWDGNFAGGVGRMNEPAVATRGSRHYKTSPLESTDDLSGSERR
jgi:hypothetical protein